MRTWKLLLVVTLTTLLWSPPLAGAARPGIPVTHGTTLAGIPTADVHRAAGPSGEDVTYSSSVETPIEFSMVAFDLPRGAELWVRTRANGKWGAWAYVEHYPDDEGPDDLEVGAEVATHPLWVRAADGMQLRVQGARPEHVKVHLIDSMGLDDDGLGVGAWFLGTAAHAATRPAIISRAQWGADESWRSGDPSYASRVDLGVLHHTAGSNDYTKDESPGIVRGIYYYHTKVRGWSDIGYNLLVDKYGQIFEGRYGGLNMGVIGAHARDFNTGSFGLSLMGNFTTVTPSSAMTEAAYRAIAWQWEVYGINPDPKGKLTRNGIVIRTLSAHRDVGQTSCPGDNAYPILDKFRSRLPGDMVPGWVPLMGDWDGDGIDTPVWHKDKTFRMVNLNVPRASVWTFDYGRAGDVPVVGDWDGDGRDSIGVFRDGMWYLRNQNNGGPADIQFQFGASGDVPVTGDWDGDGVHTAGFITIRTWNLRNDHLGGSPQFTFNYGRLQDGDLPLVGDWDADGADRIGIVRDGEWHLRHELDSGVADEVFKYGRVLRGDRPVTGRWTAPSTTDLTSGTDDLSEDPLIADGPAVVRGSGYYLRHELSSGNADIFFPFPGPGA